MNYIERYIYAVKKVLPPNEREDVGNEIRTLILEQVSEDAPFEKIEKVLKSLGSPRKLAYSYRSKGRYLIGPEHFELYYDFLKIGLSIFVPIAIFFGVIESFTVLFSEAEGSLSLVGGLIGAIIGNIFSEGINATIMGFGLITLGFVLGQRFGWLNDNDEWMLKELPDLPKKEINSSFQYRKVLFETIGVIAGFSILLIVLRLPWLAFSDDLGDVTIITPSNYNIYFPFLLGLVGFYGLIQLLYLKAQSLTKLVISLRAVLSILIITTFSFMFFGPSVFFLAEDINSLSNIIGVSMSRLESQINLILGTILVFIVGGRIFDLYKDIKAYKKQSLN